jgi:hypothetical protein
LLITFTAKTDFAGSFDIFFLADHLIDSAKRFRHPEQSVAQSIGVIESFLSVHRPSKVSSVNRYVRSKLFACDAVSLSAHVYLSQSSRIHD